jgi:ABC-type uncharacterized transport system substrate-binding protein
LSFPSPAAGATAGGLARKPADIPFERGFKSLMVLNVNAAKNLGLNLSPSLIAEADTIIE